VKLFKAECSCN